jgi:hypothetical protein
MKANKKKYDIFSQNVIPSEKYIIKGDKNAEHEIQPVYLRKMSSRYQSSSNNKRNYHSSFNVSLYTTEPSFFEKKTNFTAGKKEKILNRISEEDAYQVGSSDSDNNDDEDDIINQNKSSEFLKSLFNRGVCHDEEIENIIELTQRQREQFKLKNNNPFVYSFKQLHPFSMFYGTKYNKLIQKNNELKLPAPNFITKEDWCKPGDVSFKYIYKGIEIKDKLGIVISDPVIRKKFSGLVKDIILQLFKVPFGHHISLNVKIFEPKTILERYTSIFSYANIFLLPACEPKLTPFERLKYVITFQFAGLYIASQQLKPFNPFLGETYQGELPNGAKLYVENVTHKPLVARFLLFYKKKYEISGYWDLAVNVQKLGSEMIINQKGPVYVKFPELNECIVYHLPYIKVVNASSENDRALVYIGNQVYSDTKNGLKAVIQFNMNKNSFHEIKGSILKYEFPKDYKFNFEKEWEFGNKIKIDNDTKLVKKKNINKKKNMTDNYEKIETISGDFFDKLYIGEQLMCDINKQNPEHIRPTKHCIPSDGRYREDLIWLHRSFYGAKNQEEEEIYRDISMEWKVMMEEFNRWERKNRATYKEKMNIKKK